MLIGGNGLGQIEYFVNNEFTQISPKLHQSAIMHLKYLPYKNGYVASASYDHTINVWDTLTWKSIQIYTSHAGYVHSLDQIDNDTMVSGSEDQTIQIWRISTVETLQSISVYTVVYVVRVFSIEYKQIVCGTDGSSDNLQIYNYETGALVQTLIGHSSSVLSIEMLDEQFMASGGQDQKVIIWNLSSYTIKYTLTGHTNWVTSIKRLSSNLIAGGDYSGKINVWNWLTGEQIFKLTGHTNSIYYNSLDLYDDQTLISGSLDQTVKFWNIKNGTLIQSLNVDIQINALATLKSGELTKFNSSKLKLIIQLCRAIVCTLLALNKKVNFLYFIHLL